MSKLIVVVGVTGTQGSSVATTFLSTPGYTIRGLTRNPTSARALSLSSQGVEILTADLSSIPSLIAAFAGASIIFSTTDFWDPVFSPLTPSLLQLNQTLPQYAYELEKQHGMNIAHAAAATEGLERFITSSLCDASYWSQGQLRHVFHFDSKAVVVRYIREEMPELSEKMSVLMCGSYMGNFGKGMVPAKQDGSYRIAMVGKGDTPIPFFDAERDTGVCVKALLNVEPGKNLLGTGDMLSWKEFLRVWCRTQNVPYGGYDEVALEDFAKNSLMGYDLGLEFAEMFALIDDPGYDGGDPSVVLPKDLGVPCLMTSWEEYCKQTDFSRILNH